MIISENLKSLKSINTVSRIFSSSLFGVLSFALLTAVAAQIAIPVKPVPFTLQTMIVLLSGAVLGAKKGFYSQVIYLTLGAIGLPVFAQTPDATFGIARLIGPTGGYLLAFPLAAFLIGYLIQKNKSYTTVVASMFFGELLIITIGVFHLNLFYVHNFKVAVQTGAAIFSVWMVIKVFVAAAIFSRFNRK
ncbi:MAG: biotin transporter BioY [Ignavibacteriales bacterium]|nr:MAG: biotin transporter BioY [Ignavibacteriales bacterium]